MWCMFLGGLGVALWYIGDLALGFVVGTLLVGLLVVVCCLL